MKKGLKRFGIFGGAWLVVYGLSLLTPFLGLFSMGLALLVLIPLTWWMVRVVVPECVEFLAEELFATTETAEVDRYLPGFAAVGRGDYEEARRIFREICGEEPLNERIWVRWYEMELRECEDPVAAGDVLWAAYREVGFGLEQRAFFLARLVDVYDRDLKDEGRMIEFLREGARELGGTVEGRRMGERLREMGL